MKARRWLSEEGGETHIVSVFVLLRGERSEKCRGGGRGEVSPRVSACVALDKCEGGTVEVTALKR